MRTFLFFTAALAIVCMSTMSVRAQDDENSLQEFIDEKYCSTPSNGNGNGAFR